MPAGAVVWLDDLDRHLQAGVDTALIRRILAIDHVRVVATMRAAAYEQLKPASSASSVPGAPGAPGAGRLGVVLDHLGNGLNPAR